MIPVRKIIYATDFSSYSTQAYFHALRLAESYLASLNVVYVYTPQEAAEDLHGKEHWRAQLEQIRPLDSTIGVEHHFLEGDPAREIVRHAERVNASLIVMGTHSRSGVERLLMGSVAEKVMRNAPCSVLIVKLNNGYAPPQPNYSFSSNGDHD